MTDLYVIQIVVILILITLCLILSIFAFFGFKIYSLINNTLQPTTIKTLASYASQGIIEGTGINTNVSNMVNSIEKIFST